MKEYSDSWIKTEGMVIQQADKDADKLEPALTHRPTDADADANATPLHQKVETNKEKAMAVRVGVVYFPSQ